MTKKNNEKVIYLATNGEENTPLINLYSIPTKCPFCHSFQKPEPISFHFNYNDALVQFSCVTDKCKSTFSAFYIKGSYGKEQYHFLSFV
ncbi:hypothetical protein [Metabacillus indicus]|uniref:hypothetical protein n=1 Tax=Metabacillus indicus TaxID=246786 RepID=UPI002493A9FB|nr:hypothetical protein [Metabacillus indicus]